MMKIPLFRSKVEGIVQQHEEPTTHKEIYYYKKSGDWMHLVRGRAVRVASIHKHHPTSKHDVMGQQHDNVIGVWEWW